MTTDISGALGHQRSTETIRRLALTLDEAAAALGMSRDAFDEHVRPELRLIRRGRLVRVAVAELESWANRAGEALW